MKRVYFLLSFVIMIFIGCGIYTFSGSTLPSYLKTVDIPLFGNQSLQPAIAEDITNAVSQEILSTNILRIVNNHGDATINGTVISYSHHPYTYESNKPREVDVSEYEVNIVVSVEFTDNKRNKPLYSGKLTGQGIYDVSKETEENGKRKAIKQIVDQILQNSVQSW